MPDITWSIGKIGQAVNQIEKHEYLPPMRQTDGMSDGQKETVRRYNSMRSMLIKHGLMEEK